MASTRTACITTGTDARRFIDKRYRGIRIGMRVGAITQEQAEQRLRTEIQRVDLEVSRTGPRAPPVSRLRRTLTGSVARQAQP